MADEATVFAEGDLTDASVHVRQFTVADATAITKGTLMVYSGADRTAVAHGADASQRPLGFATSSKAANDGKTTIGLQRSGVVKAVASGSWTTGDVLVLSATANRLKSLGEGAGDIGIGGSFYINMWRIVARALENATTGQKKKVVLTLE